MTTVEEVICKARDLAEAAGKKTEEMVNLTKLKWELSETRRAVCAKMEDIGRAVYTAHTEGVSADEKLEMLFADVAALEEKIAAVTAQIDELRGAKACDECGANNPNTAGFCQNCGKKL